MILYTTTFNNLLYEKSGKDLLKSFIKFQKEIILVCYEDKEVKDKILNMFKGVEDRLILCDITNNEMLLKWTEKYKKYIPKKYGGVQNPDLTINLSKYINNKIGRNIHNKIYLNIDPGIKMFRENTARWFRKIVCLREAQNICPEKIVFCDADIIFKQPLSKDRLNDLCKGSDFIYHMGIERLERDNGVESGFMVFNMYQFGGCYLNKVVDCYMNGSYLQYKRWDDGYIFFKCMDECDFKFLDVVQKHNIHDGHVVKHGLFADYIEHFKGRHKNFV